MNKDLSFLKENVIAHRGVFDNKKIPENSIKAFKDAISKNYVIELDVHLTIDGKVYAWGYSHNIALEMIASFGFLGIVFLLIIAVLSYKAIFRNEDETWRSIFILFFCCSVKLLVSDSFWFLPYFWARFAVIKCQKSKRVGT